MSNNNNKQTTPPINDVKTNHTSPVEMNNTTSKKRNKYVKSNTTSILNEHHQYQNEQIIRKSNDDNIDIMRRRTGGKEINYNSVVEKSTHNMKFVQDIRSFFDRLNLTSPNPKLIIKTCKSPTKQPIIQISSKPIEYSSNSNMYSSQQNSPKSKEQNVPEKTAILPSPSEPIESTTLTKKTAEQVENTIYKNDENTANQFSKVKYLSFPPSKANRNESKFPLSAKTAELKYSELGVMIDNDVAATNQTTFTSESSQTLSIKALVSPNKLVKPSFSSHQDQDLNRKPLLASTEIHTDNLMSPKKGKTTMY